MASRKRCYPEAIILMPRKSNKINTSYKKNSEEAIDKGLRNRREGTWHVLIWTHTHLEASVSRATQP